MTGSAHLARPRIALVDDDETTLWVGQELLAMAGCDVRVYSAPAALLGDLPYSRFDAFVVDWNLGRQTAEALVAALRAGAYGKSTPIILLTGESDPDSIPALAAARTLHRCTILTKPTPWRVVYDVATGCITPAL